MGILKTLGSYNWDAKVVLAFVAFAFKFGDFLVMPHPYSSNPLLKSVPLLEELPKTQEQADTFKQKFVELSNLIKATLNMTKCIVDIVEFESHNTPSIYQEVGIPNEKIASIAEVKFARKVSSMHIDLKKQLNQLKEKKRSNEASRTLGKVMKVHTDNIQVMKGLIYANEDQLPLLKGDTETRVSIEALKNKIVLLLISDMYITDEQLFILKKMYITNDPTRVGNQCEMVWIPVVDRSTPWTHAKQDQFETRELRMPWYSVYHPLMIDIAVIMYIQEVWQFKKNPIIVVLHPQGKVVNSNALPMIQIWGGPAFPFTSSKEAELWAHETWTFEFLAGFIYAAIPIWRAEDNYMCLYGGGNMDWIKKFTITAQGVAEATRIKLQILYVGKSNPGERIRENISIITVEKLSYSLQDLTLGSAMAMAKSEIILQCLTNFDLWRKYMNDQDFVIALNHYNRKFSLAQLIESQQLENMTALRELIYAKEDQLPLLKGDTKTKDPTREERQYEVVWIPVVDRSTEWNEARQQQFENHQSDMPWYSVYHPSLIDPAVIIYIQEVRQFNKKPILVVLDPQGKLVNTNALHMLWIWGSLAFPFTSTREAELWTREISRIELLANSMDATIPRIQEENYRCLYGGENIDWIREFTATARNITEATSIPLQILYVGRSNSNEEQVRKIIDIVIVEKLTTRCKGTIMCGSSGSGEQPWLWPRVKPFCSG
ncbi:hypothetical protein Patl1_33315 [Pistacia atlantica]|uniref:Uncharacterized protein n=1 Tax=Pistacia atlantica TaxID=434234 RepID=A0ACC0ZUF3_9ROSI|nr:hypothetical protein Patl1_33315 [Pistacia atlantica]